MYALRVMYYDRDRLGKRPLKNAEALRGAFSVNGVELSLDCIERARTVLGQTGVEDLLLGDSFPYDAVIVHGWADNSDAVLKDVKDGLEIHGMPLSRVIHLCSSLPADDSGVRYVPVHGGNGHLNEMDTRNLVGVLHMIAKEIHGITP